MRKTMKLLVLLGAVAPFLQWSASSATAGPTNGTAVGAAVTADGLFTNTIVAKGKGVSVSRSELDEEFNQRLSQQLRIQDLTRQQWEQQSIERAMLPIVLQRELKIDITTDEAR